jgi:hypothetical protein
MTIFDTHGWVDCANAIGGHRHGHRRPAQRRRNVQAHLEIFIRTTFDEYGSVRRPTKAFTVFIHRTDVHTFEGKLPACTAFVSSNGGILANRPAVLSECPLLPCAHNGGALSTGRNSAWQRHRP